MEIAIYGKGGIGKSTIAANLSAALSISGKRVLQIGCDPKHDSTRLLLGRQSIVPALDYMRVTNPQDYSIDEILYKGYNDIACIEAGGPEPGVGCAGRGIISMFELLGQFGLKHQYDTILYDVLGDVVCGGFAVPIRREYADTIILVTSGEFMALYAANNILRGVQNYNTGVPRVAGIILNRRGVADELGRVDRFAKAVGLPIIADIPRSDAIAKAETKNMTLEQCKQDCIEMRMFRTLAQSIVSGLEKFEAKPLDDDALESSVLAGAAMVMPFAKPSAAEAKIPKSLISDVPHSLHREAKAEKQTRYLSKNIIRSEPLHGCAFNGAMTMSSQIKDAVILAHAPKSCVFISYQTMSSTGRRRLFERGALLSSSIAPNIDSTDMGEREMVFGGMEKLEEKIQSIKEKKPKAIIVISACPSGIIGDDIDRVRELGDKETPVFTLKTDGNLVGDYLQGMLMSYTELARQVIDRGVKPEPDVVNIVFEKVISKNTSDNFAVIESYLSQMGVKVNCRFLSDTSYDSLVNFKCASLNLPGFLDYTGKILKDFFESEFGSKFFDMQFPVGYKETEQWLRELGAYFGKEQIAQQIIGRSYAEYEREMSKLRDVMSGKRLMIMTYNHELDWLLGAAMDAGIEIVKLGILNFSQDEGFRTGLKLPVKAEENYNVDNRNADIRKHKPDILLTNYTSAAADNVTLADTIPMAPAVGFFTGLEMIKRWAGMMGINRKGDWERDEKLFRKYYPG